MATAVRRSAVERSVSHSRRDAVVREFLPLADALARRFQRRFPDLIEIDDARQVARFELLNAVACLMPRCCTSAAYLKLRMQGARQHYLRDHRRLVGTPAVSTRKAFTLGGIKASMPSAQAKGRCLTPLPTRRAKSQPAPKATACPLTRCCRVFRRARPRFCAYGCSKASRCGR